MVGDYCGPDIFIGNSIKPDNNKNNEAIQKTVLSLISAIKDIGLAFTALRTK